MSSEALQALAAQSHAILQSSAGDALRPAYELLNETAATTGSLAKGLSIEFEQFRAGQRTLLWKGCTALVVGSVLAASGSAYIAWRSQRAIAHAEFSQKILDATKSGSLAPCGDSLCARVGKKPLQLGNDGEYAVMTP